jgi:hypothetical protein
VVAAYEARNLVDVITLEQVMVTGCDAEGASVNAKKLEGMLRELLRDERLL